MKEARVPLTSHHSQKRLRLTWSKGGGSLELLSALSLPGDVQNALSLSLSPTSNQSSFFFTERLDFSHLVSFCLLWMTKLSKYRLHLFQRKSFLE